MKYGLCGIIGALYDYDLSVVERKGWKVGDIKLQFLNWPAVVVREIK